MRRIARAGGARSRSSRHRRRRSPTKPSGRSCDPGASSFSSATALTDPGVGDPPGFKLGDCKTERNLNAAGRAEAKRVGEAFRREKIPVAQVLSSEWCRCRDTAQIAFGTYEVWPALNNLFGRPENVDAQRRAMLERAGRFRGPGNLVLVTHGSTVVPVAGVSPATAEMVVMKPAGRGQAGADRPDPGRAGLISRPGTRRPARGSRPALPRE